MNDSIFLRRWMGWTFSTSTCWFTGSRFHLVVATEARRRRKRRRTGIIYSVNVFFLHRNFIAKTSREKRHQPSGYTKGERIVWRLNLVSGRIIFSIEVKLRNFSGKQLYIKQENGTPHVENIFRFSSTAPVHRSADQITSGNKLYVPSPPWVSSFSGPHRAGPDRTERMQVPFTSVVTITYFLSHTAILDTGVYLIRKSNTVIFCFRKHHGGGLFRVMESWFVLWLMEISGRWSRLIYGHLRVLTIAWWYLAVNSSAFSDIAVLFSLGRRISFSPGIITLVFPVEHLIINEWYCLFFELINRLRVKHLSVM